MIQLQHVSRRYGDFVAVDGVSFEIGRGEIVGLLGHNGAGKSTIMKMITGFLEPSEGTIRIAGDDIWSDLRGAQSRIGYLPENCPVYPEMTVVDFLDYSASLRGLDQTGRDRAVLRAIHQTELEEKASAAIATLSRGYRQRVGVAQALLHQPEILILDEPTNGLDPSQIGHMRELIRELGKQATVIVSTHILQEVEAVCDRALILRKGQLALDAQLAELTRGRALILRCSATPEEALEQLSRLPGVIATALPEESGCGHGYRLEGAIDLVELAPAVAELAVGQKWQLYDLHREERTLEKVFNEISLASEEVGHAA